MLVLGCLLLHALAEEPALTRAAIARAEWTRDVPALLAGPYEEADLAVLARALGRTRDPAVLDRLVLLARAGTPEVRKVAVEALGSVPGAAAALRVRVQEESELSVRAAALRALGRVGDVTDVGLLAVRVARPAPEGAAAAEALGRLARRGVDVGGAVPALLAALGVRDPERSGLAAWALSRVRPAPLGAAEVAWVREAWARTARDEVRGWLLPWVLEAADDTERRALVRQVIDGPWRATRAALLAPSMPLAWTRDELVRLAEHPDAWVRQRVSELLPLPPAEDALELTRREVIDGGGGPEARARLLLAAQAHEVAAVRSSVAAALLLQPSDAELDALQRVPDAVVRELVGEALGERSGSLARVSAHLGVEGDAQTALAWLASARRRVEAGEAAPASLLTAAQGWADTGTFLVRQEAAALLARLGRPRSVAPVLPGPPGFEEALTQVHAVRAARVSTTEGEVRLALDPDTAPVAVAAFAWLAERDAFDGLTFHRVVPAFVVQTGDPRGDGMGGPGWFLPDETGGAPFVAGSVGMARSGPDSGGSQWFVVSTDQPHLAGDYTRFGQVTLGLDVVRRLDPADRVLDVQIERVQP